MAKSGRAPGMLSEVTYHPGTEFCSLGKAENLGLCEHPQGQPIKNPRGVKDPICGKCALRISKIRGTYLQGYTGSLTPHLLKIFWEYRNPTTLDELAVALGASDVEMARLRKSHTDPIPLNQAALIVQDFLGTSRQ